jgi:hypothetical protein
MNEREQFEAWATKIADIGKPGSFMWNAAWKAWQERAARAALEAHMKGSNA